MNTGSHSILPEEQLLLQSLRRLSSPEINFIQRAIDAMAQQRATHERATEGGNPQSLTTTKEKHHA